MIAPKVLALVLLLAFVPGRPVEAAPLKGAAPVSAGELSLRPEVLGAKAVLEDLLMRRYSQELSTVIDRQAFSLGAQLELVEAPNVAKPAPDKSEKDELPADFLLGTLDPEEILKKYADPEEINRIAGYLSNYRIRAVSISVGLKEDLGAGAKDKAERWLSSRLTAEFGKVGKGTVAYLQAVAEKKAPPKTPMDWLSQFQTLAGEFLIALSIIMGILLWKLLASRDMWPGAEPGAPQIIAGAPAPNAAGDQPDTRHTTQEVRMAEEARLMKDVGDISRRLGELAPMVAGEFERVVRLWCQAGEEGKLKLACFAEAAGREVGKLPIPADALEELLAVFGRMPGLALKEKRDVLQKAYWDVLAAVNLGSETMERPFGFLGGLDLAMINQVLLEQNPRMKTLVALYMPPKLRESYVGTLDAEVKAQLLAQAAELGEISTDELKGFDGAFRNKLKPTGARNVVVLESPLAKVASALSPIEQVALLPRLKGAGFTQFKLSVPSLAFIGEWPDDKLGLLLSRVVPDEIVAFLRLRPDLRDRLIALCPAMTAEVAADELSRSDGVSESDKNIHLRTFSNRIREMIEAQEVVLHAIFSERSAPRKDGRRAA